MSFKQHRANALIIAGLAALLLAPVAVADDWVAKWSNGHKIENGDKGHKLKFGGRIMADYQFADSDTFTVEDGFEFRRARLFFSGTIYERSSSRPSTTSPAATPTSRTSGSPSRTTGARSSSATSRSTSPSKS